MMMDGCSQQVHVEIKMMDIRVNTAGFTFISLKQSLTRMLFEFGFNSSALLCEQLLTPNLYKYAIYSNLSP